MVARKRAGWLTSRESRMARRSPCAASCSSFISFMEITAISAQAKTAFKRMRTAWSRSCHRNGFSKIDILLVMGKSWGGLKWSASPLHGPAEAEKRTKRHGPPLRELWTMPFQIARGATSTCVAGVSAFHLECLPFSAGAAHCGADCCMIPSMKVESQQRNRNFTCRRPGGTLFSGRRTSLYGPGGGRIPPGGPAGGRQG